MKCLEKAPGSRYASARELAEDLQRFLKGEPVRARRIGGIRRAWRWLMRHPQAAALGVVLLVLAALLLHPLIGDYQASRERRLRAEREASRVREILQRNCFECHGRDPVNVKKNLNILDRRQLLDTQRRIVIPGEPDRSRLIQRIADGSMPPEEEETRLPRVSEEELAILKDWVLGGAPPFPPPDSLLPPAAPRSELATQVMGIFHKHCYKCHKFDVAKGGIKILNRRLLVNIRHVVVPGRPEDSELYRLIASTNDDTRMPPLWEKPLSPEAIATIRQWIEAGAPPFPKRD